MRRLSGDCCNLIGFKLIIIIISTYVRIIIIMPAIYALLIAATRLQVFLHDEIKAKFALSPALASPLIFYFTYQVSREWQLDITVY